jgi:hypothetical protein
MKLEVESLIREFARRSAVGSSDWLDQTSHTRRYEMIISTTSEEQISGKKRTAESRAATAPSANFSFSASEYAMCLSRSGVYQASRSASVTLTTPRRVTAKRTTSAKRLMDREVAGSRHTTPHPNATATKMRSNGRTRSNENKLSHRWRERALLRSLMLKSCESYSSERPEVGWSAWLGLIAA